MSELRQDPVTGVWTVMAPERAGRPKDFRRTPDEAADASDCPFCPGHESMTPPTRLELALPGEPGMDGPRLREPLPVAHARRTTTTAWARCDAPAPYRGQPGFGVHEVIVETPRHAEGLADYTDAHAALLVDAYADRIRHWREDGRFAAAVLFRNFGMAAGASLAHPHTQFVAMPRVPDALVRELGNFSFGASEGRSCLLCDARRGGRRGRADRVR